jgi:hypothetical protein
VTSGPLQPSPCRPLPAVVFVIMLLAISASARAQADLDTSSEDAPASTLQSVPPPGWRLATTLYGGLDTNPLDAPDGPSDLESDLAAKASYGSPGRGGRFGFSLAGARRWYATYSERNIFRGAAQIAALSRLSRRSTATFEAGATYDYTDNLLTLTDLGLQLPRTKALSLHTAAGFQQRLSRRTDWLSEFRFARVTFESDQVIDTDSLHVASSITQRFGARSRDALSLLIAFDRTGWTSAKTNASSFALSWTHSFRRTMAIELTGGASRMGSPATPVAPSDVHVFALGSGRLTRSTDRSSLELSYRRSLSPGYGFGQFLYSQIASCSASHLFATRWVFAIDATLDRSSNPFQQSRQFDSRYVNAALTLRTRGRLSTTLSYRYRYRDSSTGAPIDGSQVGLAATLELGGRKSSRTPGKL